MSELVEFLRARLNEDERAARAAMPGPWKAVPVNYGSGEPTDIYEVESTQSLDWPTVVSHQTHEGGGTDQVNAVHIARHDPARVLAEVDAKRRIVDDCDWGGPDHADVYDAVLQRLALPYASHPDYRDEWRPA